MRLGLLACDHVSTKYRHLAGDYPDMFAALLGRDVPELNLTVFDVCSGEFPTHLDDCDAYLCTGSRYSILDDVDWIRDLKAFLRRLQEDRKPFVGICFGHQALADALGGEVAPAEGGWGVGAREIEVLGHEKWMQPPRDQFRLAYMHQDQVVRLPDNAELLARSEHCPIAVFRVGPSMVGIQAHPEFPRAFSEALIRDRVERIGPDRAKEALLSLEQPTDEDIVARWIAEFLQVATRR